MNEKTEKLNIFNVTNFGMFDCTFEKIFISWPGKASVLQVANVGLKQRHHKF